MLVGHDIGGGIVLRAHLLDGVPASRLALLAALLDFLVVTVEVSGPVARCELNSRSLIGSSRSIASRSTQQHPR
ncbi:hypothetical protein ACO0M4_28205 [Streptomyces sp. RGM 3693]|uniref:hypothetical protein n=1 Tax=Streptomyces sp. RGM 3693 TaxID=3413284 RepID=UPI003D2A1155